MSAAAEIQSAYFLGPKIGSIAAIDFTTSSASVSIETEIGDGEGGGVPLAMISTVAVYFAFGATGDAIDETNVAPGNATRCFLLPANTLMRVWPTGEYIITKGTGAGILRLYRSSLP